MKRILSALAVAAAVSAVPLGALAQSPAPFDAGQGNARPRPDALTFAPGRSGTDPAAQGTAPVIRSTTPPLPVPSDYGVSQGAAPSPYAPAAAYTPPPPPAASPPPADTSAASPAAGQRTPPAASYFDMGAASPRRPPAPGATAQQGGGLPAYSGSDAVAPPPGAAGFQMGPASPGAAAPRTASASAKGRPTDPVRFIVPYSKLRLEGEVDSRSWIIFLTADEAAKPATLAVGYINAVMVMPEASRLRVSINNQLVLDTPITSSSKPARISVQMQPGLIRPGANTIRMEALQRHRTDCNYQATYELWTDILSNMTGLNFGSGSSVSLKTLDDLPAVGLDALGRTNIRMIVPSGLNAAIGDRLLRLAQTIAVRGRYPHPIVTVTDRDPGAGAGSLNVIVGPAADLARNLGSSFPGAGNRSLVTFANDPRFLVPTLIVTGLTWADVDNTIASVEQPLLAPNEERAKVYDTATWLSPNVPILEGARTLRLSDLDIQTQEFSGRRFHVRFAIGLPVDFYASAYGQAMLYLDAAYSEAVRQSSHLDVYVNGNIASTVDLDAGDGDILRHAPVKIPMKHFRPGVNEIVLESILITEQDARCGPAATIPGANRLVVFNTTEFAMPSFARIARLPNLDAFSATGFPYNGAPATALVLSKMNAQSYAAAGTMLARVARGAGHPIAVDSSATLQTINDRPAIFVGLAGELPPEIFSEFSISERARVEWPLTGVEDQRPAATADRPTTYSAVVPQNPNAQRPGQTPTGPDVQSYPDVFAGQASGGNRQVYDRWNDSLAGGRGLRGEVERLGNWFERTFDLSYTSMRLVDPEPEIYDPTSEVSVMLAQEDKSGGTAPWTLLTARSQQAMQDGLAKLTAPEIWSGVAGRLTAYQPSKQTIQIEPVTDHHYVVTESLGFTNARLILANWMSTNILVYALSVLLFCIVLGVGTSELLDRLGRRR